MSVTKLKEVTREDAEGYILEALKQDFPQEFVGTIPRLASMLAIKLDTVANGKIYDAGDEYVMSTTTFRDLLRKMHYKRHTVRFHRRRLDGDHEIQGKYSLSLARP